MQDSTKFPSPVYQETVLEPIFDAFKANYYSEMMAINYAHIVILVDAGVISLHQGQQLITALQEIQNELDLDSIEYTGEFEDLFFYIEKQLIKKLGIEIAGLLHTGRSRNDINITLFKMKTKQHLRALLNSVLYLQKTLLDVAEREKDTIVVAYTHGQPAQPTTFGHYLGALIEILGRDTQRLLNAYYTTDQCSMGAAAITTSGFALDRERIAHLLGFARPQENSYGCIAAVDYLLEVYSNMKILFVNLGRFAQDLNYWTAFEVGHLYVPNEFVQISSIMPQKRNPVAIEYIRIQAATVIGLCDTVINGMRNTPFTDMNDAEDSIQVVGFEAFNQANRCLKLIASFTSGLQVDKKRVLEHIDQSFVTITELADSLVRLEKLSFRAAHDIASRLVSSHVSKSLPVSKIDYNEFEEFFCQVAGRKSTVSREPLLDLLNPRHFVAVRERQGGPGPEALARSLNHYGQTFENQVKEKQRLDAQEKDADKTLQTEIGRLMSP